MDRAESIQMPVERIDHAMVWPVIMEIDRVAIEASVIVVRMDFASCVVEFALGAVFALKRDVALDAGTMDCRPNRQPPDDF